MKSVAKKKSKGNDGISQECLLLGTEVLAKPLTSIINDFIECHFPRSICEHALDSCCTWAVLCARSCALTSCVVVRTVWGTFNNTNT